MKPRRHALLHQQQRIRRKAANTDAYAFFNLLTSPELFDCVESLLPDHRERRFPPTETLSMFMAQALSADRSCQKAVNDLAIKQLLGGLKPCRACGAARTQTKAETLSLTDPPPPIGTRRNPEERPSQKG